MPQKSEFQPLLSDPQTTSRSAAQLDYRETLNRWAIARCFPDMQQTIVARFRSRSDADGHLRSLRRQIPDGNFVVVVDSPNS